MVAVRALREKAGTISLPSSGQSLELSRVRRGKPPAIADRVCRVASYYMKEWTGLEPLPTDPKPR